jgi:hypothetical protein
MVQLPNPKIYTTTTTTLVTADENKKHRHFLSLFLLERNNCPALQPPTFCRTNEVEQKKILAAFNYYWGLG